MHPRTGRLPILVAAVGLVAATGRGGFTGETAPAPALVLPERPANYADPDLPGHFRTDPVRRLDNAPAHNPTTDAGATLGRALFYDRRLSADGTISCGSCHVQGRGFADAGRYSKGVGGQLGDRNSMSLVNARFNRGGRFFWDNRARTLEEQVLMPVVDPREMAHDVARVVQAVGADPAYDRLFRDAFGDEDATRDRVARALAQFVRSIVSYRSKFDEGMASAPSIAAGFANFTPSENLGKRIFLGDHDRSSRGNCASCHLRDYDFRAPRDRALQAAVFQSGRLASNGLDADFATLDNGLGDRTLAPADFGLFRVPDLRNVELTAPYMHDGRFATLEEVVEHYNSGVKAHPNLAPQLRDDPRRGRDGPRLMNLGAAEKAALVDFLKTLTDRELATDPKFSDPFRR